MVRKDLIDRGDRNCAVTAALKILRDCWTLLLVADRLLLGDQPLQASKHREISSELSPTRLVFPVIQASFAVARADMRVRNVMHQMLKVAAGQVHERAMIAAFEVDVVGPLEAVVDDRHQIVSTGNGWNAT